MPDTRPDCSSFPISVKDTDRPQGDQIDRWGALQAENKRLRAVARLGGRHSRSAQHRLFQVRGQRR